MSHDSAVGQQGATSFPGASYDDPRVTLLAMLVVSLAANLMIRASRCRASQCGPRPLGDEIERIVTLGIRDFPP